MPRSREELSKLTVVDLKAELKTLGQSVLGKKDELVDRLLAAESGAGGGDAPATDAGDAPAAAAAAPAAGAEEGAKAPDADAAADPAAAGEEGAAAAAGAGHPTEPQSEDGGSKGDAKRAKIEFNEKVIKAMPAKVTVIKSVPSDPVPPTKSAAQKLKERADRFKDPAVEKVKQRAERFGLFNADVEREKAKKRAERFGTFNPDLDEERKQKRAERFGIEDPEAKLQARADRFKGTAAPLPATTKPAAAAKGTAAAKGSSEFETLKEARAARFGLKA